MSERGRWSLTTDEAASNATWARTTGPRQVFGDAVGHAKRVAREYERRWPTSEPYPYVDGERTMQALVAYLVTGLACWDICVEPGPLTTEAARNLYTGLVGLIGETRQGGAFCSAGAREVLRGLDRDLWALRGLLGVTEGPALGAVPEWPAAPRLVEVERWLLEQWEADFERAEACS